MRTLQSVLLSRWMGSVLYPPYPFPWSGVTWSCSLPTNSTNTVDSIFLSMISATQSLTITRWRLNLCRNQGANMCMISAKHRFWTSPCMHCLSAVWLEVYGNLSNPSSKDLMAGWKQDCDRIWHTLSDAGMGSLWWGAMIVILSLLMVMDVTKESWCVWCRTACDYSC